MESLSGILQMVLAFLLKLVELIVAFIIEALTLFLDFFRTLVSMA